MKTLLHLSKNIRFIATLSFTVSVSTAAHAQIADYFDSSYDAVSSDANLSIVSSVTSSTFSASSFGGTNYFLRGSTASAAVGDSNTLAYAITNDQYVGFTLAPEAGFEIEVTSLSFDYRNSNLNSATGETFSVALLSSVDNFTNPLGSVTEFTDETAANEETGTVSLSGFSGMSGIDGSVEFRLYTFYNEGTGGTTASNDLFRFGGIDVFGQVAVSSIPEPHHAGLLIGASFCMFVLFLKKRK